MPSKIEKYVSLLAKRFNFDLTGSNRCLWVSSPLEQKTYLVIIVWLKAQRFTVGQMLWNGKRNKTGFRVYYTADWQPLRAVDENGLDLEDLTQANEKMVNLVISYLNSRMGHITSFTDRRS